MRNVVIATLVVLLALFIYQMAADNTIRTDTGYTTPLEVQHYPTYNPQRTVDASELQATAPAH